MKNKEVIQRIQQLYSKGVHSDDSRLKSRHIYSVLKSVRNLLLTQQMNKKQALSNWSFQTLPCVELIEVPDSLCPCVPPSGCTILRSKYRLPSTVKSLYGDSFKSVFLMDKKPIPEVDMSVVPYSSGGKYTSNSLKYFINDGYIYVVSDVTLKIVTVVGVFEDPIDAERFENFCSSTGDCIDCMDYMELEFPIDGNLIKPLLELTYQEVVSQFSQGVEDKRNDSDGEQR